ncbi:unnamed protein product [Victoria cruziana]
MIRPQSEIYFYILQVQCIDKALLSLKIWEGRQKNKKERMKKRKDRKHKEKSHGDYGMVKEKKHRDHKRLKHERSKEKRVTRDRAQRRQDENEQTERSSLTEELGQPVGFQNMSDYFDSARCRGKRHHDDSSCTCVPSFHKKQRTCEADITCGIKQPGLFGRVQNAATSARTSYFSAGVRCQSP